MRTNLVQTLCFRFSRGRVARVSTGHFTDIRVMAISCHVSCDMARHGNAVGPSASSTRRKYVPIASRSPRFALVSVRLVSGTVVASNESRELQRSRSLISVWTQIAQPSAGIVFRFWPNLVADWKMLSASRPQFVCRGSKRELGRQSADPVPSRLSEV
jgi:hypothetical protein